METSSDHGPNDGSDLIRIELRLGGSSPTGRATNHRGDARGFSGWVGLMSAVDALAASGSAGDVKEEQ